MSFQIYSRRRSLLLLRKYDLLVGLTAGNGISVWNGRWNIEPIRIQYKLCTQNRVTPVQNQNNTTISKNLGSILKTARRL